MEHEDVLKGFESLWVELEYEIADIQRENADRTTRSDAADDAKTEFKLTALRCVVEVALEILTTMPKNKTAAAANRIAA